MNDAQRKKWLLAAVICLAPGGFILGASLAANHLRKRRQDAAADKQDSQDGE